MNIRRTITVIEYDDMQDKFVIYMNAAEHAVDAESFAILIAGYHDEPQNFVGKTFSIEVSV